MVSDMNFSFEVSGNTDKFKVESFQVNEQVSDNFTIQLTLLSEDHDITFDALSRKSGVLRLTGQGLATSRAFHGIINSLMYLGTGRRFSRYQITLVPEIWFLTQKRNCRIFQQQPVPEILRSVFSDAGVSNFRLELSGSYPAKEYLLQYRESDHHFVQRIMAEHGLWYYFEHTEANHTMVILDSNDAIADLLSTPLNASHIGPLLYHSDQGGMADQECISDLQQSHITRIGQVSYNDYNYLTPDIPQGGNKSDHDNDDLENYDYPGRYISPSEGAEKVNQSMEALLAENHHVLADSNIMRLTAGYRCSIHEHPRQQLNRSYLLLKTEHTGYNPTVNEEEAGESPCTYSNRFVALPDDITYRAAKLNAPVVDGPHTAVVTGPAGEEIYTDELGRIRVQFHWDREGENNEQSSCWLRVSQSMAAPGWGAVYLPRIGHEVVVTFLEGDPDRPLVTGSVYNGLHTPPYPLPEHKTRTVFRSQSHKGEGHNELYFEDENRQEEVYFHAQKDMHTKILNDRHREIGRDEYLKVGNLQQNDIDGNQQETVDGHKTSHIVQTFNETVERDVDLSLNENKQQKVALNSELKQGSNKQIIVGRNRTQEVKAEDSNVVIKNRSAEIDVDDTITIGKNLSVEALGNISIRSNTTATVVSADELTIRAGASSLVLKSSGDIHLFGNQISIAGAGSVTAKGSKVDINPSAAGAPPQPGGLSMAAMPTFNITSASYQTIVEEGYLIRELCQCGSGNTCKIHN